MRDVDSPADVEALVAEIAKRLDPTSRYIPELRSLIDGAANVAEVEARLEAGCRGQLHARAAFDHMSLAEKILANLITPETKWERFEDAEIEALSNVKGRILVIPCSRGEEVYSIASYAIDAEVIGVDVQPALVAHAEARSDHPDDVREDLGRRDKPIRFVVGDAFDLDPALGDFDLISCRNFLGYFVPEVAVSTAAALFARTELLLLDRFCLGKFPGLVPSLAAQGGWLDPSIPGVRRDVTGS